MQPAATEAPDAASVLEALAAAVLLIDPQNYIRDTNGTAEYLFQTSRSGLLGVCITEVVPEDNLLHSLVRQVRESVSSMADHGIPLETNRISSQPMSVHVSPVLAADGGFHGWIVISLSQNSIAQRIDQQLAHRHAGRAVSAMSALLAHEVKNPLAGIRGAAQLLESSVGTEDQELITLICDEVDRINTLVENMGLSSDPRSLERGAVNIHEVLERGRRLAETAFGGNVRLVERYDPSLPPAFGNRDQLIQVFVNLIKNSCEAAEGQACEIVLSTAYQHGVRITVPGAARPVELPLVIRVQDNGPGIPEDMQEHLFDPFVSAKPGGHGLGLALVAKIISEHGGLIECESEPGRTVFSVMLPVAGRQFEGDAV